MFKMFELNLGMEKNPVTVFLQQTETKQKSLWFYNFEGVEIAK